MFLMFPRDPCFIFLLDCVLFSCPVPLQGNLSNFDLIMESDMGTFAPVALQFSGSDAARKVRDSADDLAGSVYFISNSP